MTTNRPKLPGKAPWAGRRRAMTRKSGFSTRASGSQLEVVSIGGYQLAESERLTIAFHLPTVDAGHILGFGGWFVKSEGISIGMEAGVLRTVLVDTSSPNWGKFGSQWYADGGQPPPVSVVFTARTRGSLALYGLLCGEVRHEYLESSRPELMTNMHAIAPEANFINPSAQGTIDISSNSSLNEMDHVSDIHLKSCNRCTRLLPINIPNEKLHLSFTNHCSAPHLRPCRHSGFGRLVNVKTSEIIQLDYGFQLECRLCKKFEVNDPHNSQRTAAQLKEDATRRRLFETLLDNLYKGAPQLRYLQRTGRELTDDIWEKFGRRCFKCGTSLTTPNDMHRDHTRPLALLWPLDKTATSLCATHNSEKRDRPPVDYYTDDELIRLSKITGIPLPELRDPSPNLEAIQLLGERLDWFVNEFLTRPDLNRQHDGKLPRDLLVKALNKVLRQCPGGAPFLVDES